MALLLALLFLLPPHLQAAPTQPEQPERATVGRNAGNEKPAPGFATADIAGEPLSGEEPEAVELAEEQTIVLAPDSPYGLDGHRIFNPDPTRAVWLSALCPGLGQIYNRRYWKLPIVVGGFVGLAYATNWNNNQYRDYSQGFRDLSDSDPATKSYMDFFPPTTDEADLDKAWLTSVMQSRKNFYRRNRDLCIVCMAALYLICMVDAYVDASMMHFDISDDLSLDLSPTMMVNPGDRRVSLGLNWAFTF